MENNVIIDLKNISVSFDGEPILKNLNLYIRDKEFITLLGPSGCGKTTTLRIIGGFLEPDEGTVIFDGKKLMVCRLIRGRSTPFFSVMRFFRIWMYTKILPLACG